MDTLGDKGRRRRLADCEGGATGMNTTNLIAQWTMIGGRDFDGSFRATDDIGALIADNPPTPEPMRAPGSFLIKGADGDGWQPVEEDEKNHCA